MLEDIAHPTAERLRRGDVLHPQISQTVNRRTYRSQDEFDRLHSHGVLDAAEHNAAIKLRRHWLGAQGVDVRNGEGGAESHEFPRTHHSQQVADAERATTPRQWRALIFLLEERGTIEQLGGSICQRKCPKQARAAGMELVKNALDPLAILWGYAERNKITRPT